MTLSKSQIDKLGERLRTSVVPSEADLNELNALLESHQTALRVTGDAIHEVVPDFRVVAVRLKTARTTIDKLHRNPKMALSRVQDLAGARVVVSGGRNEQDRAVAALRSRFKTARVVDRRQRPQQGYRAVHVIPRIATRFVEIQVRTIRQHEWAEIFEKTADICGRQIRYGEPPDPPSPKSRLQEPQKFIDLLLRASGDISSVEEQERTAETLDERKRAKATIDRLGVMMKQILELLS